MTQVVSNNSVVYFLNDSHSVSVITSLSGLVFSCPVYQLLVLANISIVGVLGGCPFLYHLRTSLIFDTIVSLAFDVSVFSTLQWLRDFS